MSVGTMQRGKREWRVLWEKLAIYSRKPKKQRILQTTNVGKQALCMMFIIQYSL